MKPRIERLRYISYFPRRIFLWTFYSAVQLIALKPGKDDVGKKSLLWPFSVQFYRILGYSAVLCIFFRPQLFSRTDLSSGEIHLPWKKIFPPPRYLHYWLLLHFSPSKWKKLSDSKQMLLARAPLRVKWMTFWSNLDGSTLADVLSSLSLRLSTWISSERLIQSSRSMKRKQQQGELTERRRSMPRERCQGETSEILEFVTWSIEIWSAPCP